MMKIYLDLKMKQSEKKALIDSWVGSLGASYIKRFLGLSPMRAEQIKAGNYDGYEQVLFWAATQQDQDVSAELKSLEGTLGLPQAHLAAMLGLPPRAYERARKGIPVKIYYVNLIKAAASQPRFLNALFERSI